MLQRILINILRNPSKNSLKGRPLSPKCPDFIDSTRLVKLGSLDQYGAPKYQCEWTLYNTIF